MHSISVTTNEIRNVGTIIDLMNHTSARMLTQKEAFDLWMVNVGWKNYKKKVKTKNMEILNISNLLNQPKLRSKLLVEIVGDKCGRFSRRKVEPNIIHELHGAFSNYAKQERSFYKPWK